MKKRKTKVKTVYYEDKGETIYSMAALEGKTPEQKEEEEKNRKNFPTLTGKERRAMISAAFSVYGPLLLMLVGSFALVALFLYFFLK
ncbi:MAG: hypothetical protein IJD51_05635 [Clostridia bacterium]|nr:hypothetical protein [Clostridia bacterium]